VGSQARGSIIRPASYCANYALKPTFGALNALGLQGMGAPSQCTVGIHAATLEDCWTAAFHISANAGGDPGHPGLYGEQTLGSPRKIERLIRLDTLGWDHVEPETRDAFERFIRQVEALGVTVIGRQDDARIDDLERMLRTVPDIMWPILLWEMRWPGRLARARGGDNAISKLVLERLEKADRMDIQEYRQALTRRDALYTNFAAVAEMADACVTLCTVGPAPSGMDVGNPAFADISSNLLSPALSLPLLAVSGLPLGVQLLGRRHQDFSLAQHADWLSQAYLSSQPTGADINRLAS
jgi:Asp-tRNA(Asn)/Glu-tRNA(Gln) amidotransferase A subunit family amidase